MHEARRTRHDRAARRRRRERVRQQEARLEARQRRHAAPPPPPPPFPLPPTEEDECEYFTIRLFKHGTIVLSAAVVSECGNAWGLLAATVAAAVTAAGFTVCAIKAAKETRGHAVFAARERWFQTWPAHVATMGAVAATAHVDCFLVFCGAVVLATLLFFGSSVLWMQAYDQGTMGKEHAVLLVMQTAQWFVLCSGVLVLGLQPVTRVYALLGCQYGHGMTLLLLEVNPAAVWRQTRYMEELWWLRWSMAVSWAVAVAMVPLHDYAAWFSLVPVVWMGVKVLVWAAGFAAANVRDARRWLGWSCRVAWHGVPCAPQDATCCICWEHPGPDATLCIRCGVGTPDPMSFACEECRDTWLQHENTCPICRTEDWPVVFPVSP